MSHDAIRRRCPWCDGLFYLDEGHVALCPHCRKAVKATSGESLHAHQSLRQEVTEALCERAEFWQAELAAWAAEFGEAAVRGLREWLKQDAE